MGKVFKAAKKVVKKVAKPITKVVGFLYEGKAKIHKEML